VSTPELLAREGSAGGLHGAALLRRGEIHVWKADADVGESAIARHAELLTPDEIGRASGFRFQRDRARFVVRRALLRSLIGRYTGTEPASIRFVANAWGKPMLSEAQGGATLRFNASHSDSVAIFAFALEREVGVDIERVRHIPECLALAERVLPKADVDALRTLHGLELSRAFLSRWTECEAMAKAQGIGLPRYLIERSRDADRSSWSCETFDAGEDLVVSVASNGPSRCHLLDTETGSAFPARNRSISASQHRRSHIPS